MKAKANYSAITGMISIGQTDVAGVVSFSGGDALLKQSDQLYQAGQDQDARLAVREALKIALQRLDAVHGTGSSEGDLSGLPVAMDCKIS